MKVESLTHTHEIEALGDRWNDLVSRAGATIFQTLEWQSSWCRCFASGRALQIAAVWAEDTLVGLMPLFRDSVAIGKLPIARRLQFVGAQDSDYLNVIAAPGYEERVAEAIADHLCTVGDWDLIRLDDVPERSPAAETLVTALIDRGCAIHRQVHHRCFAIPLPSSREAYLARLSGHTRSELLRNTRRLFEAGLRVEMTSGEGSIEKTFDDFLALHMRQWASKGQQTILSDPRTRAFHREVARRFHRSGWLNLASIGCHGRPAAFHYDFVYGDRYYGYLGGTDLDSPWAHRSPSMVLLLKCIEFSIQRGLREFDLLRGAERYKISLGARETITWRYEIAAPRASARGRTTVLRALRGTRRLLLSADRKGALIRATLRRVAKVPKRSPTQ